MDTDAIDRDLADLREHADAWARLPVAERIDLLRGVRRNVADLAREWVDVAVKVKRLDPDSPLVGEEWISGPWVTLASIDGLLETLERLRRDEDLLGDLDVHTLPSGQLAVRVLPHTGWDRLLLSGYTADVWIRPGIDRATLARDTAGFYRDPDPEGAVAVVLGAGNIASIPPLDVCNQLFEHGRVVVLKMNPVNEALGPVFERIFAPLVDGGFLRFAYGGAEVGAHLVAHDAVDAVHMTGAARTHDAIVWGTDPDEVARRKRDDDPRLDVPVSSELGGVSPIVVVPGAWSDADIAFHAQNIATMKLHNHGCNCIAGQVLVLPAAWEQADDLLAEVRRVMAGAPGRPAHYPGEADRERTAVASYPQAQQLGAGDAVPTLIVDVDPDDVGQACFHDEYFGPVLAVTRLPGADAGMFLRHAVAFANDTLTGTLGANVIVDPATEERLGSAFDEAIADLRYGGIGINAWSGLAYLAPLAAWGAFPGHTLDDVGSGIGVVHNARLLAHTERTVARGPFRPMPRAWRHGSWHLATKPPWFVTHRHAAQTGRLLTAFTARPAPATLARLFAAALRG